MRSRYTAYTLGDWKYIHKTWHKSKRPTLPVLRSQAEIEWLGLKIVRTEAGTALDDTGMVEFIATFKTANGIESLHESSRFVKESGQWLYLDGDF